MKVLPYKAQQWIDNNIQIIQFVFMILFIFGILGSITAPIIEIIITGLEYVVSKIFFLFI